MAHHRTIDELVELTGVSWNSYQWILSEDLGMKQVSAKFVLCLFMPEQRDNCLATHHGLEEWLEAEPDFFFIVSLEMNLGATVMSPKQNNNLDNGKLSLPHDPEKHNRWSQMRKKWSLRWEGVPLRWEGLCTENSFLRVTVNRSFYLKILRRLCHNLRKKHPNLWQTGDWFFHHDSAPACTTLSIQQFLSKNSGTPVPHPPYSPVFP